MDNAIRISHLNDFLFCPYSIYLHNIYDAIDDHQYHDVPQMKDGDRIQYSVYEIHNSERILNLVLLQVKELFEKSFTGEDSVIIFKFNEREVLRFGNAQHREKDLLILGD